MDKNNKNIKDAPFHSGFVAILGKPNVGKSTLINAIVGRKVAITSSKPQTTRHRIMGVKNGENYQIVFVDTPGVHNPTHQLGRYMEKIYKGEIKESDAVVLVVEATHIPNEDDLRARDIVFGKNKVPDNLFLVINKIDRARSDRIDAIRQKCLALGEFSKVFEISALKRKGLNELQEALIESLKPGPCYFPQDMTTDQSLEFLAAEIVREKILNSTRQEIPHSVFVHTEKIRQGKNPNDLFIDVYVYVERNSQKGIIIGKGGEKLKSIGILARKELELLVEKHIFIQLWVKVKEDWKDRKDLLKAWGYEI